MHGMSIILIFKCIKKIIWVCLSVKKYKTKSYQLTTATYTWWMIVPSFVQGFLFWVMLSCIIPFNDWHNKCYYIYTISDFYSKKINTTNLYSKSTIFPNFRRDKFSSFFFIFLRVSITVFFKKIYWYFMDTGIINKLLFQLPG